MMILAPSMLAADFKELGKFNKREGEYMSHFFLPYHATVEYRIPTNKTILCANYAYTPTYSPCIV